MEFLVALPPWIVWLGIAIYISRWLSRRFRQRWLPLLIIPLFIVVPCMDVIVAKVVGERWVASVGGAYRVNEVVVVPGYLNLAQTDTDSISLSDILGRRHPYEYVEIQYTKPVYISWRQKLQTRPGYYQFRPLNPGSKECDPQNPVVDVDIWQVTLYDRCVRITRTEVPISHYSWELWTPLQPGPWAGRLGIRGRCLFAREISTGRVLAQECTFVYPSVLGVLTPDWRAPSEGTPDDRNLFVENVLMSSSSQ